MKDMSYYAQQAVPREYAGLQVNAHIHTDAVRRPQPGHLLCFR